MRRNSIFWGNEICCAAYAFVNAVQEKGIDYKLFEAVSSVPFGIKHQRENDFSRLLTTYCDPNIGIERAAGLWGYKVEKEFFTDERDVAEYVAEKSKTERCVVGPINMGNLDYLIMPNLYANMDHYITVYQEKGHMYCMDSEGIVARKISKEEMQRWFCITDLPEAGGYVVVRNFKKMAVEETKFLEEGAVKGSVKWIQKNLVKAQGSRQIEQCMQWLAKNPLNKWKLSFLYDISYLVQRKILQIYWSGYAMQFSVIKEEVESAIKETVEKQILLLGKIFNGIQKENYVCESMFYELSELEKQFSVICLSI